MLIIFITNITTNFYRPNASFTLKFQRKVNLIAYHVLIMRYGIDILFLWWHYWYTL